MPVPLKVVVTHTRFSVDFELIRPQEATIVLIFLRQLTLGFPQKEFNFDLLRRGKDWNYAL